MLHVYKMQCIKMQTLLSSILHLVILGNAKYIHNRMNLYTALFSDFYAFLCKIPAIKKKHNLFSKRNNSCTKWDGPSAPQCWKLLNSLVVVWVRPWLQLLIHEALIPDKGFPMASHTHTHNPHCRCWHAHALDTKPEIVAFLAVCFVVLEKDELWD